MTLTVATVIDRIYREYLNPADDFPSYTLLETGISDSDTSLIYKDDYLTVEEEDLLDIGTRIEIGRELIIVGNIDTSIRTLSALTRGALGTTAASHSADALIYLDPTLTRQAVFDALRNELSGLHPPLYALRSAEVWGGRDELPAGAWEVIDARYWDGERWVPGGGAEIVQDDPDSSTGISVQMAAPYGSRNLVRYKAAFGEITAESDDLTGATIGFDAAWESALIVGTVAQLVSGLDINAATQEFITEALERQGFPVGSGERLRNALLSYRELLASRANRKLLAREHSPVMVRDPWPGFRGV